jgi:hypothetical protein
MKAINQIAPAVLHVKATSTRSGPASAGIERKMQHLRDRHWATDIAGESDITEMPAFSHSVSQYGSSTIKLC